MNTKGFSLVEVLLTVTVFGLIVSGLIGGLIYGQQSTALAGMCSRAVILADEGLEAVRNIRDENFSNLTNGAYDLAISGNQWVFSGTSDVTDIFTRAVTISAVDANRKLATSTVNWQQNLQRTGNVTLTAYLTNWKASAGGSLPTTCNDYCISLEYYSEGTCRKGVPQCNANGETNEHGGNPLCTQLEQSNQAKALANACAEEALQQLRDSTPFQGTGNLTLGQGTCTYTVTKHTAQNRTITSIGTVGTIVRKVKITIDKITPSINVTSWQEVADF